MERIGRHGALPEADVPFGGFTVRSADRALRVAHGVPHRLQPQLGCAVFEGLTHPPLNGGDGEVQTLAYLLILQMGETAQDKDLLQIGRHRQNDLLEEDGIDLGRRIRLRIRADPIARRQGTRPRRRARSMTRLSTILSSSALGCSIRPSRL